MTGSGAMLRSRWAESQSRRKSQPQIADNPRDGPGTIWSQMEPSHSQVWQWLLAAMHQITVQHENATIVEDSCWVQRGEGGVTVAKGSFTMPWYYVCDGLHFADPLLHLVATQWHQMFRKICTVCTLLLAFVKMAVIHKELNCSGLKLCVFSCST